MRKGLPKYVVVATAMLAIFGTVLVTLKSPWGFAVWIVSNSSFLIHNMRIKERAQATLWGVYLGLAIWGFASWLKT